MRAKPKKRERVRARSGAGRKPRTEPKLRVKGKGKGKGEVRGKPKAKDRTKDKGKGKGKGKRKVEAKEKARSKRKAKGKSKGKSQTKAKAHRAKPEQINLQIVTAEELTPAMALTEEAPGAIGGQRTRRRWMQVVTNLGLEKHVRAVSRWEGQGAAPILSSFSFVRHVESEAHDLRCAGTSVAMTQGVVVKREDGKLFLIGRGVAKKYLGMEVPWKNRADAGQRFLTVQERAELGQPLSESLNTERH